MARDDVINTNRFTIMSLLAASQYPTYGELIDLLEDAERECAHSGSLPIEEVLCTNFRQKYPHVYIGRLGRFYDTVTRFAAATRPSATRGQTELSGSPLSHYRKRIWKPRIRNTVEGRHYIHFYNGFYEHQRQNHTYYTVYKFLTHCLAT